MSKGKELKYSVNRSFEEIKLLPFRDVLTLGENPQYKRIDILQSFVGDCENVTVSVLPDVPDSELIPVNFNVTSYSNIQRAR
jgi:hypothetical protein